MDKIRQQINKIDDEMIKLFMQRMDRVVDVAEYKKKNNLSVYNSARESEIINRLTTEMDEQSALYIKLLYNTIFDISRFHQSVLLNPNNKLSETINTAIKNTPNLLPAQAAIALQGISGSNSYIACNKLFSRANITYFKGFEGVFSSVQSELCKYGILPLENSIYGSVTEVYDLMKKYNFKIVKSLKLKIEHNLIANPGVKKSDIKEIISHEQALGQCSEFIKTFGDIKITSCANTAVAAQYVAESGRTDIACISSAVCEELYGLKIIESSIENNGNNYTRFIVISKDLEIYPGANKFSLIVNISHKPGALYELISKFSAVGVNLTKLESRPIPGKDFEFMFFIEADASVYSAEVINLLSNLDNITFLGAYSEV
ncbi:chorismate mutase [Eubacteriales bacterium OttesenSCG-928-G02]|nr:chorismate mutase [Eubacteriales bacterium OttesenSCG-928-G02]